MRDEGGKERGQRQECKKEKGEEGERSRPERKGMESVEAPSVNM